MGKSQKKKQKSVAPVKVLKTAKKPDKAAAKTTAEPREKERYPITLHIDAVKHVVGKSVSDYRSDLDPDKISGFKRETFAALKRVGIGSVMAVAAAALMVIPETYYDGKVMARTSVAGVSVGSLEGDKALDSLMMETERYMKTPITFIYGDKKVSLTPEELGVKPDLARTSASVPVNDFTKTNPALLVASLLTNRELPLVFTIDYAAAADKLTDKLGLAEKRTRNAHLVRTEEGLKVEPEKEGIAIDEQLLASSLQSNIASLKSDPVIVVTSKEEPRITAAVLEKEKPRLEALVNNDVTIKHGDDELLFKTIDHLDAVEYGERTELEIKDLGLKLPVVLEENQAQTASDSGAKLVSGLAIRINPGKAMPYLRENLLKDIEVPTSGVTITRNGDGKINIEGKGEDGKSVPEEQMIGALELAVNNGIDTVPVPVVTEKAPVNIAADLQDLGIKELLATGYTTFYGSSPNRMHNINVGINKYNGALVKPGEEFSFNALLGEVDAANGFVQEKVIKKNKAEMEYGGGICQVSSTIYRAALFAGLPITERNPHSWKVSYYGQVLGHGLDATIYLGVSDVKFINDTPGYLLIQSYTDGAQAYFKFYGTSDGRTVTMDGPYGGGLNYKWYRTVKKADQEIKETIVSNYKPIPPPDPPPEKPKVVADVPAPTL
jgi:vancomycin resistance protein YoaR